MQRKFFSVVFEVLDDDKFRETMAGFTQQLGSAGVRNGAQVTGCGFGDCMTEADALRAFVQENMDDPEEIVRDYLEVELAEEGSHPNAEHLDALTKAVIG